MFSREVPDGEGHKTEDGIKISRGEENIFIWCFFLAIVQLALDGAEAYDWVKYVYIDDPISSLDEQNAIAVATHLARMLKKEDSTLKTVISTHHTLFFNVLCNELKPKKKNPNRFFLARRRSSPGYLLRNTGDTPFFHHVAAITELYEAAQSGQIYTHHFNMLRTIMEKTASFHGYANFSDCIRQDKDDIDGVLHTRIINLLSHGNYSLYEPREMMEENKEHFRRILHEFIERYPFNPALFPSDPATTPITDKESRI
jgi:wobble nucleotide-excising tRNase